MGEKIIPSENWIHNEYANKCFYFKNGFLSWRLLILWVRHWSNWSKILSINILIITQIKLNAINLEKKGYIEIRKSPSYKLWPLIWYAPELYLLLSQESFIETRNSDDASSFMPYFFAPLLLASNLA